MRLLAISVLLVSSMELAHGFRGLRAMESSNPKCTAAQTKAFTDSMSAASSGCLVSTSYVWDGYADPTDSQRADLCKCTVSPFNVPKCYFTKLGQYNIDTAVHFGFVYNCQSINGKTAPKVTEVDSMVATPTPTPTPTTAAPTTVPPVTTAPKSSTPSTPATTEASTSDKLPDCTVQQLSAFKSALNIASSGCMGGTSSTYDWGGSTNPTSAQYSEICKCASVSSFAIPSCSIQKGPDTVSLPVHYNWVMSTQCPTFSPITTSSSGNKSSISIGMIGGIAGGVVLVLLIIIFVLCERNRKGKREETRANIQANAAPSPVPAAAYQPIAVTPQNARSRKNTDPRPSTVSDGSRSTISTTNSAFRPSATGSLGSKADARTPETATWDDPAITAVRIPYDSIFLGSLINRGAYGEVYRGSYKGETVAIKQLLPSRRKDLAQIDQFLGEVKLMSTLEHERIVKFVGVAWNSLSDACMVMEFMENGDLRSVLTRWDQGPEKRMNGFDEEKVKIAMHIAHALVYLHSLQPVVVHRDLKSKNILLDANMDAKLMDFGISRERADSTMTAGVGSSLWMAPEVMMGNRYDEKADIFSFGVVLSELDTHQLPYFQAKASESGQKVPEAAILQQVMLGRVTVTFTDRANGELVRLGRECVSLDPKARPTTAMLLHRVHQVMRQYK